MDDLDLLRRMVGEHMLANGRQTSLPDPVVMQQCMTAQLNDSSDQFVR